MKISQAIRDYLEYVEVEKGQSIYTLRNYQQYLERFDKFCQAQKIFEVRQIDNNLIRQFRKSMLRQTPPLKKITQNYHLIALRNLLKYLQKQNISALAPDKIELAKVGEREINVLTPEELGRLLDAPKTSRLKGLRDKAILETLFSTGLRVSELAKLEKDDINLKTGEFSVKGKGEKIRLVFLSAKAKEALEHYLAKRNDNQPALFAGPKGNRLTVRSIQRAVQLAAKQAGIVKKVTPHLLRHQFGTDLLSSGADLRSVQTLLGHSSVTTTQIYTHITNRDLRDVHAAFHGKQRKMENMENREKTVQKK